MSKSDQDISVVNMDNIRAIFNDIITNYCLENNINEQDIPPAIWNDIIDEIHERIFYKSNILKYTPNINNSYDKSKVFFVYKLYKRICNKHCQEVSLKGFTDLTGIERQSIYNWSAEASTIGFDFSEIIRQDNEQSLEAMLHDKRINPMKVLPSLNRKHNWNLPGVTHERSNRRSLDAAQLPRLSESNIDELLKKVPDVVQDTAKLSEI